MSTLHYSSLVAIQNNIAWSKTLFGSNMLNITATVSALSTYVVCLMVNIRITSRFSIRVFYLSVMLNGNTYLNAYTIIKHKHSLLLITNHYEGSQLVIEIVCIPANASLVVLLFVYRGKQAWLTKLGLNKTLRSMHAYEGTCYICSLV